MIDQQQKLVLSPYMEIYELVIPKDNIHLLLKAIYDLSDVDVVERSRYEPSGYVDCENSSNCTR